MKKYWGVEVKLHAFLTSALDRSVISFTPRPLYPQGKSPWYPFDRRLGIYITTIILTHTLSKLNIM
jgi:hypothetical protein